MGLIVFAARTPLYFLILWTAALHTVFAIFYSSVDSYVYLIPTLLCFAIGIGLALIELTNQLSQRWSFLRVVLGLLMIAYFAGRSITFVSQVNAANDARAEAFGKEVLSAAPKNAIIFAKGDNAVFALWYFHFALAESKDSVVIATDLLHFDCYQDTIHETYPSLVIQGPFPWPETIMLTNPTRAMCYARYSNHTEFNCTDPLISP
jgi:hypothetical protein